MLIAFAILCTSMAAFTGIIAVGSGRHWQFQVSDYFRGKRNAILYFWVTVSTILSVYHSGVLLEHALRNNWTTDISQGLKWIVVHCSVGVLFIAAHLFVATVLSKQVGPVDKYLWGSSRAR
jgi:hypothetical protein